MQRCPLRHPFSGDHEPDLVQVVVQDDATGALVPLRDRLLQLRAAPRAFCTKRVGPVAIVCVATAASCASARPERYRRQRGSVPCCRRLCSTPR